MADFLCSVLYGLSIVALSIGIICGVKFIATQSVDAHYWNCTAHYEKGCSQWTREDGE